jgi:hypothetical protein
VFVGGCGSCRSCILKLESNSTCRKTENMEVSLWSRPGAWHRILGHVLVMDVHVRAPSCKIKLNPVKRPLAWCAVFTQVTEEACCRRKGSGSFRPTVCFWIKVSSFRRHMIRHLKISKCGLKFYTLRFHLLEVLSFEIGTRAGKGWWWTSMMNNITAHERRRFS